MKFDWFDGGGDAEFNSVSVVEIPRTFATQKDFLSEAILFD